MQRFTHLLKGVKYNLAISPQNLYNAIPTRYFSQFDKKETQHEIIKDDRQEMNEEEAEEHRKSTTKMFWLFISNSGSLV